MTDATVHRRVTADDHRRAAARSRRSSRVRRATSARPCWWPLGADRSPTSGSSASSASGRSPAASPAASLLGLVNHLATEYWLLQAHHLGRAAHPQPARPRRRSSGWLVLSVVAVGIAVVFWPDGIGLLLGLAIFRLIALVMTTIPLLKELKKPVIGLAPLEIDIQLGEHPRATVRA